MCNIQMKDESFLTLDRNISTERTRGAWDRRSLAARPGTRMTSNDRYAVPPGHLGHPRRAEVHAAIASAGDGQDGEHAPRPVRDKDFLPNGPW